MAFDRIVAKTALMGVGLLPALASTRAQAAPTTPNVVLIMTDDQGFNDIGCFGAKGIDTPNLDELAREGRRFTNFHSSQPICTASRAGLITGCYPTRIGFKGAMGPHSNVGINAAETTLPQIFKSKGYATGMVGKWHLGDNPEFLPTQRGFDEYYGIPYSHDMWPFHPETPKAYPPLPLIEGTKIINPSLQPADMPQLTTNYTERAVSFIERNKEKPFFLYLAHNLPHVPLFVSDKFKGKSQRGLYGDVIEEIDWSVGEVMKTLKKHHLEDNTIFIFCSDNGPWLSYGDHAGSAFPFREGKHTNWEGGTRVPCIMRWPGHIPANTVSNQMLCSIDLLPTLAHQVNAELPKLPIDGLDIWPLLSGQPDAKNPHEAYYFYYGNDELQAVTSGDGHWKLLLPHTYVTLNGRPGGTGGQPVQYDQRTITTPELYDLENDRSETKDVATQYPAILARLQADAESARADLGDGLTRRVGKGTRPIGRLQTTDPQIVGKALTISCEVTVEGTDGVILAQGGTRNGFALHLSQGKPVFSVRQNSVLTTAAATEAVTGHVTLLATLDKDGGMTLSVNGKVVATAKAPGLFAAQPNDELSIGQDTITAVGDYQAPFPLKGEVSKVKVVAE